MERSPDAPPSPSRGTIKRLTVLALAGLVGGLVLGLAAGRLELAGLGSLLMVAEAIVRAWTNAFRALVAPLVVAQLYLALAGNGSSRGVAGRLGLAMPVVFLGLLAGVALVSAALVNGFLAIPWFQDITLPGALAPAPDPATASAGVRWVDGFIPPNLVAAASSDNILPLMLFTVAFALAMRRAEARAADVLLALFRGVSHATFTLVGWLLLLTPLVMLALGLRAGASTGMAVGEVILAFAVLENMVCVVVILGLFPVTALLGKVAPRRLARALWPAQLTAAATRSSLAALPTLLRDAEAGLGLRMQTAATVLPMAGATLKLSRAVTGPVKLLFLASVLRIGLTPVSVIVFLVTIILLSAATVGVPSVISGNRSLPAYVAAGIPAEYVVLLGVAVNLTDNLLSVLNATGYLSAACLAERLGFRLPAGAPDRGAAGAMPPEPARAP